MYDRPRYRVLDQRIGSARGPSREISTTQPREIVNYPRSMIMNILEAGGTRLRGFGIFLARRGVLRWSRRWVRRCLDKFPAIGTGPNPGFNGGFLEGVLEGKGGVSARRPLG